MLLASEDIKQKQNERTKVALGSVAAAAPRFPLLLLFRLWMTSILMSILVGLSGKLSLSLDLLVVLWSPGCCSRRGSCWPDLTVLA